MEAFYNERFFTLSLGSFAVWTWIFPILLGAAFFNVLQLELRYLTGFAVFSLLFEYFSGTSLALDFFLNLDLVETRTNYPYYHLVTPVFCWFQIKIFAPVLRKVMSVRLLNGSFLAFLLFCAWNAWKGDGYQQFNGNTLVLLSISCILMGVTYFIYLLQTLITERPERSALFWLSSGTVIYYSGSFLVWLAVEYINVSRAEFYSIYNIHSALSILLHLCYCVAIWVAVTEKNQDLLTTMHS